jgi:hypothetical protein
MTKTDLIMLPILAAMLACLAVSVKIGLEKETERVYSYAWRCCNEHGQAYRMIDLGKTKN